MTDKVTEKHEAADDPAERWAQLTDEERDAADRVWNRTSRWVANRVDAGDEVGKREMDRRIAKALHRMVLASDVVRPALVLAHKACENRPDNPHDTIELFEVRIMHFLAVLELYGDCRKHQKWQGIPGRPGPARTLWEKRRGLDSSLARWEYASEQMVAIQLMDERPTWGEA